MFLYIYISCTVGSDVNDEESSSGSDADDKHTIALVGQTVRP